LYHLFCDWHFQLIIVLINYGPQIMLISINLDKCYDQPACWQYQSNSRTINKIPK